ncbi:hypothetical protein TNCV_813151 [Trichonephila clavipes]|nr:hypothetical protein TNCV_813151 [Trichonephila clavipes]
MDFMEIKSRGKREELLWCIDRQNSRFRSTRTIIIKFGLLVSSVELESAKNDLNGLWGVLMSGDGSVNQITIRSLCLKFECGEQSLTNEDRGSSEIVEDNEVLRAIVEQHLRSTV